MRQTDLHEPTDSVTGIKTSDGATASQQTPDDWKMPEWMEPYRDMFVNTGGNLTEELLNDHHTSVFDNSIRASLIIAVESQVALLEKLHEKGVLK
jgi:hypothetical protein